MTSFRTYFLSRTARKLPSAVIIAGLMAMACSSQKEAAAPISSIEEDDGDDPDDGLEMMQECGAMNQNKITRAVKRVQKELSECLTAGYEEVEVIGGDVQFLIEINSKGRAQAVYIENSDIGSHDVEQCMAEALREKRWPKPVGALIGVAHTGMGYAPDDHPDAPRAPIAWSASDIQSHLDSEEENFSECGTEGGPFKFTAYIGSSGEVLSAGVSHLDAGGEEVSSCLLAKIEASQFPSPGSFPAKVQFTLGDQPITALACE